MEWVHGRCIIFIFYLLFSLFPPHPLLTLTEGYPAISLFLFFLFIPFILDFVLGLAFSTASDFHTSLF